MQDTVPFATGDNQLCKIPLVFEVQVWSHFLLPLVIRSHHSGYCSSISYKTIKNESSGFLSQVYSNPENVFSICCFL